MIVSVPARRDLVSPGPGALPLWNNIIVGALILVVSLVPSEPLPDRKTLGPPAA